MLSTTLAADLKTFYPGQEVGTWNVLEVNELVMVACYDIFTITLQLYDKNWLLSVKGAGLKLLNIVCIRT